MPKISVYIVSHNYGRYVEEAINSVLYQSIDDWELLLFDDGSSDNTYEILAKFENYCRVRVFRTEGLGLQKICNIAVKEARGKYIIRLDGDDVFEPDILLVLSNHLDRNPKVGLVFPDYYLCSPDGTPYKHIRSETKIRNSPFLDTPPHGACTMMRKDAVLESGGYREDLRAQDGLDIWLKLKFKYETGNINLPLFNYRQHGNNLTKNRERIFKARHEIKKNAWLENFDFDVPVLAIIPIRKTNDFIPELWKASFGSTSLLHWRISECLKSEVFTKIIVTCDDESVQDVLGAYGDLRLEFFKRTKFSTFSENPIFDPINEIIPQYDPNLTGFSVVSFIQSPFLSHHLLEESVASMDLFCANSCRSVKKTNSDVFRKTEKGLASVVEKRLVSFEESNLFSDTRAFIALRNKNLSEGVLELNPAVAIEVDDLEAFSMINNVDLEVARKIVDRDVLKVGKGV